jgi:hypothetical protein
MNTKIILSALALTVAAAPSFAQEAEVAANVAVVEGAAAPVTGFTPIAGAALGAAGPLALGLGAIILVGAIAGGGDSGGTSGTTQ